MNKVHTYVNQLLSSLHLWDMKHTISARWLANLNRTCNHLPYNICSSCEYYIHYKNEDSSTHQMIIIQNTPNNISY